MAARSPLRPQDFHRLGSRRRLARHRRRVALAVLLGAAALALLALRFFPFRSDDTLVHVSYQGLQPYYRALNAAFAQAHPDAPAIQMSHAASARQARSLTHGHAADLASLASRYDLALALRHRPCAEPHPTPLFSTIAFVAKPDRADLPEDWTDLWNPALTLALPDPEQSGAGRWAFLSLYAASLRLHPDDPVAARLALQSLLLRSEIIPADSRQALERFHRNRRANLLLTWESDARRLAELGFPRSRHRTPSTSLRAQPFIAVVSCHAASASVLETARAYLAFHQAPEAIAIAQAHGFRADLAPASPEPDQLIDLTDAFPASPDIWQEAFGPDGLYPRLAELRWAKTGAR